MAGVAARLVRALQECNSSDVIWLPRRGGLLVCSMTVLAWAALMTIAAVMGAVAIATRAAVTATMTTAMTTLAVAAIWPTTMPGFCVLRCRMAR
jgi:hypothetical protein